MLESWAIGPVNRWVSSMNTTKSPTPSVPERKGNGPANTHSSPTTNVASSAVPVDQFHPRPVEIAQLQHVHLGAENVAGDAADPLVLISFGARGLDEFDPTETVLDAGVQTAADRALMGASRLDNADEPPRNGPVAEPAPSVANRGFLSSERTGTATRAVREALPFGAGRMSLLPTIASQPHQY